MVEKVGIVAVGQTKYHPNRTDVNEEELAYEAVKQVLEATGLTLSDFDAAVSCSQDFWDGRTISNMNIQHVVGAHLSDESLATIQVSPDPGAADPHAPSIPGPLPPRPDTSRPPNPYTMTNRPGRFAPAIGTRQPRSHRARPRSARLPRDCPYAQSD